MFIGPNPTCAHSTMTKPGMIIPKQQVYDLSEDTVGYFLRVVSSSDIDEQLEQGDLFPLSSTKGLYHAEVVNDRVEYFTLELMGSSCNSISSETSYEFQCIEGTHEVTYFVQFMQFMRFVRF